MKKRIMALIGFLIFSLALIIPTAGVAQAATFADGTYSVSFELKESGNNNTSIADGYFSKPATLIVKNGVNYIQLTTTKSDWVKSISGPKGGATVISESGESRTVQFEAGDLSGLVNLNMHVVVPEEVAGMKYDNHHAVRAAFNVSGVPAASAGSNKEQTTKPSEESQSGKSQAGDNAAVENPETGDTSSIGLYVILIIGSIVVFTFYRKRAARS